MRFAFVIPLILFAGCSLQKPHKPRDVPQYPPATFYETVSITGASFSANEQEVLITSDKSGVFNVYSLPLDGGAWRQRTHSTEDAHFAESWFPNDDRFLFSADQGGNELDHVYVQETDGSVTDLTPGENLKAQFIGWAEDGQRFWITTNERDPRSFDLYEYRISTGDYPREMLFRNDTSYGVGDVSPNGRWVALSLTRTNADNDLLLWDAQNPSADPRLITAHEGNISHQVATFTPSNSHLYYLSDEGSEFNQAWSYALDGSDTKQLLQAEDWDITSVSYSPHGRYRVTTINADARTEVQVLDTQTNRRVKLPKLPHADIRGIEFSNSETQMAFYVNGDTSPSNLYVLNLESGEATRLTQSLNPFIEEENLVNSEVIRYPSFDGVEIPALLYRPHPADSESKVPALLWVHGGPGGQSRTGYRADIQVLVNHGYAILAVNNRGSSGYGKTFYHMDDRRHGDVDLKDCVWARRYLESLEWVDGSRVGILGGSYGGFMVAAALAFEPEVFDVGIDIFGVTNWLRTLESIPPWWESFREYLYAEMGDPATDSERLHAISPLFHASNIKKPLLVVQGANDPRVLQAESDELVAAVRANGVPVEYVLFPDEGHGFLNKENRITASEAYLRFLEQHLR